MSRILNVTPNEYFELMDAWMSSENGNLEPDTVGRILGMSASSLRYEKFNVVVRRDCTFIPVYWRGVERIEEPSGVEQERKP